MVAPQSVEVIRQRHRGHARINAPPQQETGSALREPSLQFAPSTPVIDLVRDVEIVAVSVVESVQDVIRVAGAVEEAHPASMIVDVPNDTEVVDTLPDLPLAEVSAVW